MELLLLLELLLLELRLLLELLLLLLVVLWELLEVREVVLFLLAGKLFLEALMSTASGPAACGGLRGGHHEQEECR